MQKSNLQNFVTWFRKHGKTVGPLEQEPHRTRSKNTRQEERFQIELRKDYKCPQCSELGLRVRRKRKLWECRYCGHIIPASNYTISEHVLSWKELRRF